MSDQVLCDCGCGEPAPIARKTDRRMGYVKGEAKRFVHGHHMRVPEYKVRHREVLRGRVGPASATWEGGRNVRHDGYVEILAPDHPRADKHRGYVVEHILIAEQALGKPLPRSARVHHVNGDRADNRPRNLVVCEDDAYHQLLHVRQRALDACGHAHWRQCRYCRKWDSPENLYIHSRTRGYEVYHRTCGASMGRARRRGMRIKEWRAAVAAGGAP